MITSCDASTSFRREVTGVRGLERGIGQTFARAVGGNEILEHGQAFAEVRGDRPFDDFARRFRHQTAHAGELIHLLAIAARAGIDHQVNRVQFLAALVMLESAEHDVGNLVTRVRPDVDDLVVTLAIGDDALAILLLDLVGSVCRRSASSVSFSFGMIMSKFRSRHRPWSLRET